MVKQIWAFGNKYIVPTPLDPRLIEYVAPAVAKAAIDSGVATKNITNWEEYKGILRRRMGIDHSIMRSVYTKAKTESKTVVYSGANDVKVLQAAIQVKEEGVAIPILLGDEVKINKIASKYTLNIDGIEILNPASTAMAKKREEYATVLCNKRSRKGITMFDARKKMYNRDYFGAAMVESGDA